MTNRTRGTRKIIDFNPVPCFINYVKAVEQISNFMTTLFYLIIYDLPDNKAANKRRTRLHKMLSGYGTWTQYSVFECFLTAIQFTQMQIKIEKLIKPEEDSVRVYVLDAGAVKRTITYGSEKPRQEQVIIV